MPRYRIVALEKFVVRTTYLVEAESKEVAEDQAKSGQLAYDQLSIKEGNEEWLTTVEIEQID